jgi:putative nucleotidyltransferase with HDIG domain
VLARAPVLVPLPLLPLWRSLERIIPDVASHCVRVASLSAAVAQAMRLPEERVTRIRVGALLHDAGKLFIPPALLAKPGPLSEDEWAVIRAHPIVGEALIPSSPEWGDARRIARSHHERWDGTGYPDGLAGERIPLPARIVSTCDAYDAITSLRPYKSPLSPADALAALRDGAGAQFDPEIARLLAALIDARLSIAIGQIATGGHP